MLAPTSHVHFENDYATEKRDYSWSDIRAALFLQVIL